MLAGMVKPSRGEVYYTAWTCWNKLGFSAEIGKVVLTAWVGALKDINL